MERKRYDQNYFIAFKFAIKLNHAPLYSTRRPQKARRHMGDSMTNAPEGELHVEATTTSRL